MLRALITAVRRHGHSVSSSRRDTAVLLLHGLTGTPVDMHYMKDALVADGYTVNVPLLPGRGTRPSDMDSLCWEDWMGSALAAYAELARKHEVLRPGPRSRRRRAHPRDRPGPPTAGRDSLPGARRTCCVRPSRAGPLRARARGSSGR